jgi:hypothetical protein
MKNAPHPRRIQPPESHCGIGIKAISVPTPHVSRTLRWLFSPPVLKTVLKKGNCISFAVDESIVVPHSSR